MRRVTMGVTTLLLLASMCCGQSVTMPKEVKGEARRLIAVSIDYDGDDIRWTISDKVDVFREYDPDPKRIRLRILAPNDGEYDLKAVACKDKKLCDFVTCKILIGKGPDPVPPVPPIPPDPPTPAPIQGKRVLIIWETAEKAKLSEKQLQVIYGKQVRDYLNGKVDTDPDGVKGWNIWDKDEDPTGAGKVWVDAMKRPRAAHPWVIISNGKTGYEGPLPKTVDEFLTLAKKYLGD